MTNLVFKVCVLPAACCLFVGCGGKYVPVEGRVTLDGQPVHLATVWFVPESGGEGLAPTASTEQDGSFSLTSQKFGDGVLPGTYKVIVIKDTSPKTMGGGGGSEPTDLSKGVPEIMKEFPKHQFRRKSELPEIYSNAATTPLQITIPKGGDRNVELKLDSKATAGGK